MKNLTHILLLALIPILFCFYEAFSENYPVQNNQTGYGKQFDSLSNDLILIKPIINFNDSNGGFYSEFYYSPLQKLYCGAIFKSTGDDNFTNVFLEVTFLDELNNVFSTLYSDTIPSMGANNTDTLLISNPVTCNRYYFKILYKIKSNETDYDQNNNIDTIAPTRLYDNMWSRASRSDLPTGSLNVSQIANFHSGDFIGTTLHFAEGEHLAAAISVYINAPWPDSIVMTGIIYQNGTIIYSHPLYYLPGDEKSWAYTALDFVNILYHDSTYYIGLEIQYPEGTNIPIGIDTSVFHNFQTETVARIGGTWTTLDFVPIIRLICDPEQIQTFENNNRIKLYPNPSFGTIHIANAENSVIEIYDMYGRLIMKDAIKSPNGTFNLSRFPNGAYMVKIISNNISTNMKFNLLK